MFQSLIKYRRFILRQAWADLRHRYAGTGMGLAWNVVHPLGVIAVYSIVFSSIMKVYLGARPGKLAFTVYLCSGLFPWMAFSDCVMRGCGSFIINAGYLKKLPIPEQVFVAQNAVSSTFSLVINFCLLIIMALILGYPPTWLWLLLPVPLFLLQALGFGFGLLLGTLNVFFHDVGEWTTIILQMVMWTIPIVYLKGAVPWLENVLPWHPLYPAVNAVHQLFFYATMPDLSTWISLTLWPIGVVALALLVLHKLRPEIRDVI